VIIRTQIDIYSKIQCDGPMGVQVVDLINVGMNSVFSMALFIIMID